MIIHVIGLEGSGHHGLESVIVNILHKSNNYVHKEKLNNKILQKSRNCDSNSICCVDRVLQNHLRSGCSASLRCG